MPKNFLVLGGYGNTGRLIARLLLQETDVRVVLAGRNLDRAAAAAATLNRECDTDRATALRVDAADPQSLQTAFALVDFVVVASSTAAYSENVAHAALAAGIDYLDVQYSSAKVQALLAMRQEIEQAGRCFITDGGFHPGLPAALVRYAAGRFDRLDTANVGSVIKIDWRSLAFSDSTIAELAGELLDFQMLHYQDGRWTQQWTGYRRFDFGPPFGRQPCAPMMLEEMRSLPEQIPSLQETGFFVGGFNWFTDWVVMPVGMAALKVAPQQARRSIGNLLEWSLKAFSRPPYGTVLQLEASGLRQDQPATLRVRLSHVDGYALTAVPVVACLLQYLDGSIQRPGLWCQANIVDAERLLRDVERMGVTVEIATNATHTDRGETDMMTKKSWNDLTSPQKGAISVAGVVQMTLLVLALVDLRRRPAEQINGSKRLWTMLAFINFVGPISYFLFGRKRRAG